VTGHCALKLLFYKAISFLAFRSSRRNTTSGWLSPTHPTSASVGSFLRRKDSYYGALNLLFQQTKGGDLIDRVMVDGRLNANPRVDEAHHRVSPAGFKYFVTEMVCWAAGGPQKYTGRSMGDSHRHLMITEEEWQAFMDDFQQTLSKFEVPQQEQEELKAIVESTKEAIVVRPFQEGPAAKSDQ
jgi:hemoglobin